MRAWTPPELSWKQTTDVEIEINGLMTYDRAIIKMDPETIAEANRKMYLPPKPIDQQTAALRSTVAYWRFEKGEAGSPVGNVKDAPKAIGVVDASGHIVRRYVGATEPQIAGMFTDIEAFLDGRPLPDMVLPEPASAVIDPGTTAGQAASGGR